MIPYLGDFKAGSTVRYYWDTFVSAGGSVARTTAGTLRVYKDSSPTQRTSSSGVTDTAEFDGVTGSQLTSVDTSDNDAAGFFAAGHDYAVMLVGAVIDGQTVNKWLFCFSIENRNPPVDVTKWSGTAVGTPDTAGYPKVTIKDGTGAGEIDTSNGGVKVATFAAGAIDANAIATDAIDADALADDAVALVKAGLATEEKSDSILARIGAFTGTGVNTVLGFFLALMKKDAETPSDIGGTFDPGADSTQAIRDHGDTAWGVGGSVIPPTRFFQGPIGMTSEEASIDGRVTRYCGDPINLAVRLMLGTAPANIDGYELVARLLDSAGDEVEDVTATVTLGGNGEAIVEGTVPSTPGMLRLTVRLGDDGPRFGPVLIEAVA